MKLGIYRRLLLASVFAILGAAGPPSGRPSGTLHLGRLFDLPACRPASRNA